MRASSYHSFSASGAPHIAIAFVPAGFVAAVSLLGMKFGDLVPTSAALETVRLWSAITVLVVLGVTILLALRSKAPKLGLMVPNALLRAATALLAAWVTLAAAPSFVSHGVPALLAQSQERTPAIEVVEVLPFAPVCGSVRSVSFGHFGAVVRSESLGGPSGSTICMLPREVYEGLRPGDRLVLHGFQGSRAFYYDRITRSGSGP